jgi:hypothetical protein
LTDRKAGGPDAAFRREASFGRRELGRVIALRATRMLKSPFSSSKNVRSEVPRQEGAAYLLSFSAAAFSSAYQPLGLVAFVPCLRAK